MSFSYAWPIALIVASNVFYQVFAKGMPEGMDTMAAMTVTYLVAAACSLVMYFVLRRGGTLLGEWGKANAAPFLLGVSVVGLEVGFICAYRAGWPVSTASIVQSAFLAVALVAVGALLYREPVTWNKLLGVGICLVGLWILNG